MGLPLGYLMGAQGSLLLYLVLIGVYAHLMNRLDRRFGVDEQ
jgi:putative solute:sodium symporter small subunit